MVTMRTILFPTDGSACSKGALGYALSCASQYGARLVALHVIDSRWEEHVRQAFSALGRGTTLEAWKGREEEAQRILQEVAEAATTAGVAVETQFATGIPHEEILRVARALPADVIIMGTHGRTGISHALMGSVTERIVRQAPCPVLTVRQVEPEAAAA